MFQVGDQVVYGVHGVCRIRQEEKHTVDRKKVTYLVLEPLGQSGSRYLVPTHNPAAMSKLRPILSREELEQLLLSQDVRQSAWIEDENQRKQCYRELIACGDREKLLCMIYTLFRHKEQQIASGKKFHLCDENFLRDAQRLLCSEVSVVMGVDTEQAKEYICSHLK